MGSMMETRMQKYIDVSMMYTSFIPKNALLSDFFQLVV